MSFSSVDAALTGLAVGDALGVPVEFLERALLQQGPVTGMQGYGTHNQPAGTWSDDSSLAFCLAEALLEDFSLQTIGDKFQQWYFKNAWTPHGHVFDIGIATREAILRLRSGCSPAFAGGVEEGENGNGSLMRILPLLFYIKDRPIAERYRITREVSAITHGHVRSVIACFYYLEFARELHGTKDTKAIYRKLQTLVPDFLCTVPVAKEQVQVFDRLLKADISQLSEAEIQSSGYVLHTLEAAIWCLLTTDSYEQAVLKAVNLGADTDTTGAVTGGLAGLRYGYENIPSGWIAVLARRSDIAQLAAAVKQRFQPQTG